MLILRIFASSAARFFASSVNLFSALLLGVSWLIIFLPRLPLKYPSVKPVLENASSSSCISFFDTFPSLSRYFRYTPTTADTYSALFKRPSIFSDVTPIRFSVPKSFTSAISLGLKTYPLLTVLPFSSKSYGNRHG